MFIVGTPMDNGDLRVDGSYPSNDFAFRDVKSIIKTPQHPEPINGKYFYAVKLN